MPKKNSLIIIGVAILIIIGITLWKQEAQLELAGDSDCAYRDCEYKETTTEKTGTSAVKSPAKTPVSPYKQTRVFENGKYVSIVTLTNTGFTPKVVEITRGESIRFVNKSGSAMRIASDENNGVPLYIALNQEKSVGQGGIYELTFTEPGIWVYNNRSNPLGVGVVYVK
ncbi:MAG: hypothetical protein Q7R64_02395 [bacterium]|nr:hypothetical protein [bacterium]